MSPSRAIQATRRTLIQNAKFAIRDLYDAIVELVTNADDRYQILDREGKIVIEIERRRGANPSILRVRDFADGMNASTMDTKLSTMGGRDSGLSEGAQVRGTHSRGAKDIAALGHVTFESIAMDGKYHKCEITEFMDFVPSMSMDPTPELRERIGVNEGTGTLVTILLEKSERVPQHDNLKEHLEKLVPLRAILKDERRTVILRDLGHARDETITLPSIDGKVRIKESFDIPGYPGARAKLFVNRASKRFEREPERFRLGGVQVESRRAVHETTLFDTALETDKHALWFYGRLVCPYIDDLCNDFDERFEKRLPGTRENPKYPLDPSRKTGLNREHPFVVALFGEALKRLRPLIEEERSREEHERANIESEGTRKRLNALEKAAMNFIRDYEEDEEPARDPDGKNPESRFHERGYALAPPYAQIIVGHTRQFWISVRQNIFPELATGSGVQIECLSNDIISDKQVTGLEPHPLRQGVIRAVWGVKAVHPTPATGLRVRTGPITAECAIEVLFSEADRYADIKTLQFERKKYRLSTDKKRKRVRLLAPMAMAPKAVEVDVQLSSNVFVLTGQKILKPEERLGVAICELHLASNGKEGSGVLTARLRGGEATTDIVSDIPRGSDLSIKIVPEDFGNQRYMWQQNIIKIAAKHPSLSRYLGDSQAGFPGQESKHFRILIAEIVSDALCAHLVDRNVKASPEEFEEADWDLYYARYSKYMTAFLPKAHQLQCPEG